MITEIENFNYENLFACAENIGEKFPFADFSVLGETPCKRKIFSLSLGKGEKSILFLGGMRGTDRITPALLLRFFERLCISSKNDLKISAVKTSNILREQKITVIPLVNPDGLQISLFGTGEAKNYKGIADKALSGKNHSEWAANARGVEPYLNFDYLFPVSQTHNYPLWAENCGPSAHSEAETQAIADYIELKNIKYAVLLCANGEKIIYSPNIANSENALMAQIFKSISGFEAEKRNEQACRGNFCEWFCNKYQRPSFEFSFKNEKEFNGESFSKAYQNAEELLMLSAIM